MMQVIWVVILVIAGLGFASILLSKLPKIMMNPVFRGRVQAEAAGGFFEYLLRKLQKGGSRVWSFILEAKDIRPALTQQVGKVKKVFRIRIKQSEKEPQWLPEVALQQVEISAKERGAQKTAEELYLETIKKDPSNRQAYENLGRLYLQEKNFSEAAETFKFLTGIDPNRDIYWSNLGVSLYSSKSFTEAASAYEKAINLNNKIPSRWVNLALCFEAQDEHTKAVKAINKALELDPRNVNYLMLLADIYAKVKNQVRCEEVLTTVLSLEPTNRTARERLMKLKIKG